MAKQTRSSSGSAEIKSSTKSTSSRVPCARKIFFIKESLFKIQSNANDTDLCIERFFHPGKNEYAYFITRDESQILEILEFAEPRRSWLINADVCSNGVIYITAPFDVTFFALHYLRKHCTKKSLAIDGLCADLDAAAVRLLTKFTNVEQLQLMADVRRIDDIAYYKYNAEKTIAWLAVKTRRIAQAIINNKVHCGLYAQSANYNPVENEEEQTDKEVNALTMACGIVGSYLDEDLHAELVKYLNINEKSKENILNDNKKKRKSAQDLGNKEQKKIKVDPNEKLDYYIPDALKAADQHKERVLSTKEKQMAKSAKGTKSISSFFKK